MDPNAQELVAPRELLIGYSGVFETMLQELLVDVELPVTRMAVERLCQELRGDDVQLKMRELISRVNEVQSRLFDEIDSHGKFFYIPAPRARMFAQKEPLGEAVSKKFPQVSEDSQEAAKCYACARYTACVFHLMRVMEYGVQRLGSKLGIVHPENLVWQVILDQVNKKIGALQKSPKTKRLAEVASHLYAVKIAWRNEVMHPKATYTEEEAQALVAQVGLFMAALAKAV